MNELKKLQQTPGWSSFQAFSRWVTGKKFPQSKLEQLIKTHVDFEDYKGNSREEILAHFSRLNEKTGVYKVL
jgi:hypothetical protein